MKELDKVIKNNKPFENVLISKDDLESSSLPLLKYKEEKSEATAFTNIRPIRL